MVEYQATIKANEPCVIAIGNFDGIHLGHQQLLHETYELARTLQYKPVLVTFSPHTLSIVRPQAELRVLTTLKEKLALTKLYGHISDNIVITFTPEVVTMSASAFINDLRHRFSIQGIVVGADFSLGRHHMGNVQFLQEYGQAHTITIHSISLAETQARRISSTHIRTLVSEGNIDEANKRLGHPMIVNGIVQHGDQRGRLIGFPTANLRPDASKLLPADGVYAANVHIQNPEDRDLQLTSPTYASVVNVGVRPTFNGTGRLVEAHLLDTNFDLYDKLLIVEFIDHLRGERRFSGIDALKQQIALDAQKAHHVLSTRRVSK